MVLNQYSFNIAKVKTTGEFMEDLVYIVVEMLLIIPGAFIRKLINYKNNEKEFKDYLEDDWFINGAVGFISCSVVTVIVVVIYKYVT
tara:strand:- start:244025 stop:244285 length:261 start_codon:yes stop_codon:yes gene_type:complete